VHLSRAMVAKDQVNLSWSRFKVELSQSNRKVESNWPNKSWDWGWVRSAWFEVRDKSISLKVKESQFEQKDWAQSS